MNEIKAKLAVVEYLLNDIKRELALKDRWDEFYSNPDNSYAVTGQYGTWVNHHYDRMNGVPSYNKTRVRDNGKMIRRILIEIDKEVRK